MLKKLYYKLWQTTAKIFKGGVFTEDANVSVRTNLFYSEDQKNNSFDAYYPKKKIGRLPTVIMIHGGGYIVGDKCGTANFCKLLAERGFLVFNMEYTKCGQEEQEYFPTQMFEFYEFYKHISENSEFEDMIDFNNIFLAGDSAGAHIASLVGNMQTNQELKMEFGLCGGPKIKGLILLCPCFGIFKFAGLFPKKPYHEIIFGDKKTRNSLCEYTHNLDILTEGFPPTLMISVKNDIVVGVHKNKFLKLAEELKLSVKHYDICSGYKLFHSSLINYSDKYPICFDKIEEFIDDACHNRFVEGVIKDKIFEIENTKQNENVSKDFNTAAG